MLPFSTHQSFSSEQISLVRTGTDPDGNCFFHAYLYSVDPLYRDMDYPNRLQKALEIKKEFANRVTVDDMLDLIDVSLFETLQELIERHLKGYTLPDLSIQPLLSLRGYLLLVYQSYPHLSREESFQYMIHMLQHEYHQRILRYIIQNGTFMIDSYIDLFMKKMNVNIIMYSHQTGKPITHGIHYPVMYTILMYHITDHFESVGRFENGRVIRLFENN
jgi:hypothetical protein